MNRQIKFRVWDIEKKCFIPDYAWALLVNNQAFGVMMIDWENYREGEYFYDNAQILMQFTGLQDKNDKEIFELDLVHIWGGTNFGGVYEYDFYGVCEFLGGAFYINTKKCCYGFGDFEYFEVIGNIYETPELLKTTENE